MSLHSIGPSLWQVAESMRFPGGVHLPVTATVAKLPDGSLWLHAPVGFGEADAAAIDALGEVRHIVAPNLLHHLFAGEAQKRWPQAQLHGARGLPAKRKDLAFAGELGDSAPPAWAGELAQCVIDGAPMLNETVWFHHASQTLITTDLVFHVRAPMAFGTRMALTMMGTYDKFAQSRYWWRYTQDRAAFRRSMDRVLQWPLARVTMSHGTPVATDAQGLAAAMWMLR